MILGVVGSRSYDNYQEMLEYIELLDPDILVSGGAKGADKLAEKVADTLGIDIIVYPAKWDTYGKSAGYIRNTKIVENSEHLIAFWDGKSKGTKHSIDLARKNNVPVTIILY